MLLDPLTSRGALDGQKKIKAPSSGVMAEVKQRDFWPGSGWSVKAAAQVV